jgi:hypothetical protein
MPELSLAPGDTADFHGNSITRGYRRIPVVFTRGERSTDAIAEAGPAAAAALWA